MCDCLEYWATNLKYKNYAISSKGRVWDYRKNKFVKHTLDHSEYMRVYIENNKKNKSEQLVHRLVLETFISSRPEKMIGRHFPNRDKNNNCVCNLLWGTSHINSREDRLYQGTLYKNKNITIETISKIKQDFISGLTPVEVSIRYNISLPTASKIRRNKTWADIEPKLDHLKLKNHRGKKLDVDSVLLIKEKIINGESILEIAKEFNVTDAAIHAIKRGDVFKSIGPDMTKIKLPRKGKKLNECQVIDIKQRLQNQETIDSISKLYNVGYSTIQKIKSGITFKNIDA